MTDWSSIGQIVTAGATLVLSVATFAAVRSSNRTARAAEEALQVNLRPVLSTSRLEDPMEKVAFVDGHWIKIPGGHAVAEVAEDIVYVGLGLRNVGQGIAVLHAWTIYPDRRLSDRDHGDPDAFRRLSRDLYVPPGGTGFLQGALRDPSEDLHGAIRRSIEAREAMTIELLYGDHEGGQRAIIRFGVAPVRDDGWYASAARYWHLDRRDPR